VDEQLLAMRIKKAWLAQPVGGKTHQITFLGLALIILAAELVNAWSGDETVDPAKQILWSVLLCVTLALSGFFPLSGGVIFIILSVAEVLVGAPVALARMGIYAIAADWISRRWYGVAFGSIAVVDTLALVSSEQIAAEWISVGVGWVVAVATGYSLRWYRTHLVAATDDAEIFKTEALAIEETVRDDLAESLHDTVVRDLVRISLTGQAMVAKDPDSEEGKLIATLANDALQHLRSLIRRSPEVKPTDNIYVVINACVEMLRSRDITLKVSAISDIDARLNEEQRLFVGLTVREAAMNILKYADSPSVATLSIEGADCGGMSLVVKNKIKTTSSRGPVSGGFGLENLATHAERIGADLYYWPTGGTWVLSAEIAPPRMPLRLVVADEGEV
jgi:hypothetical protein